MRNNRASQHLKANKTRAGFTVIEVLLFVAISAALIVGLMISMMTSIARQRYNDAVQDLADFLKVQYYAVSNPTIPEWDSAAVLDYPSIPGKPDEETTCGFKDTGIRRGQSRCQLFGRLIVFGEDESDRGLVNTYLVIGRESNALTVRDQPFLTRIKSANIFVPSLTLSDSYNIQWDAAAENLIRNSALKASVLIIRPPFSGNVQTYVTPQDANNAFPVRNFIENISSGQSPAALFYNDFNTSNADNSVFSAANAKGFASARELDICVNSEDIFAGGARRNIRIKAGGSNASAVEVIAEGGDDNRCLD
jgi:Tfp pilus assembly protein PilE